MSVSRSTVSFKPDIWARISQEKNRSRVINNALNLYFSTKDFRDSHQAQFSKEERTYLLETLDAIQNNKGKNYTYEEVFNRTK